MTVTDPVYEPQRFKPDPRSVFGPIVSAFEIEDALVGCVRKWIRDYLAEVQRQRHLEPDGLPEFRSIVAAGDISKFPEDQLPSLMIASPGLDTTGSRGRLEAHGDGGYVARWRVECNSEISARGNRQALRLARLYTAAVRTLLVQQALDRDDADDALELRRVEWTGERYDLRDSTTDRTRAAGTTILAVEVAEVTNRQMGPLEPLYPPTGPGEPPDEMLRPIAETKHVTVTKRPQED